MGAAFRNPRFEENEGGRKACIAHIALAMYTEHQPQLIFILTSDQVTYVQKNDSVTDC